MKINHIKELKTFIKTLPDQSFGMPNWAIRRSPATWPEIIASDNFCGTAMCAGGACNVLQFKQGKLRLDEIYDEQKAAKFLGLTRRQARRLFYPSSEKGHDWSSRGAKAAKAEITMRLAGAKGKKALIRQLNYMIRTGKV